jgi:hypothetical protein
MRGLAQRPDVTEAPVKNAGDRTDENASGGEAAVAGLAVTAQAAGHPVNVHSIAAVNPRTIRVDDWKRSAVLYQTSCIFTVSSNWIAYFHFTKLDYKPPLSEIDSSCTLQ